MEINSWTATNFQSVAYDENKPRWNVTMRRADGTARELHPRHLVMATGASGIPNIPAITNTGISVHARRFPHQFCHVASCIACACPVAA